jgi:transcription antitermination protein NusB
MTKASAPNKSARRRARELALQGLYQWQLAQSPVEDILRELTDSTNHARADGEYFQALLQGAIQQAPVLTELLQPHLDRRYERLTPIERAVLLIGAYEMTQRPEIPPAVVINEAVELTKTFGGTDGHKFVNGVLDKLAAQLRGNAVR